MELSGGASSKALFRPEDGEQRQGLEEGETL